MVLTSLMAKSQRWLYYFLVQKLYWF